MLSRLLHRVSEVVNECKPSFRSPLSPHNSTLLCLAYWECVHRCLLHPQPQPPTRTPMRGQPPPVIPTPTHPLEPQPTPTRPEPTRSPRPLAAPLVDEALCTGLSAETEVSAPTRQHSRPSSQKTTNKTFVRRGILGTMGSWA
jgi:hypothetical protein